MNAAVELLLRKAAIGAGDDVLAADEAREPQDAFGDEFGMLHDVRAVADDARGENLAFRQLARPSRRAIRVRGEDWRPR